MKFSAAITIKELDQILSFATADMEDAVVAQEVYELRAGNKVGAVSIDSLKGRVKGEVPDRAESLSGTLKVALSIADGNEEGLELFFGSVTEHCEVEE